MSVQYPDEDCLAAVQLVAWMTGQECHDITIATYQWTGMNPSYGTVRNRFDGWTAAKTQASEQSQCVPSHLRQYYQSVAALRRARDLIGHPVTGMRYRSIADSIGVPYHEVVKPFQSWTQAKIVARVHYSNSTP